MITRAVLRTTRQRLLQEMKAHLPRQDHPLKVMIDLTTLEKCGKFWQLRDPTADEAKPNPWVRVLNVKQGLHLVVMDLILGDRRVPWRVCIWKGKGSTSPAQLGCKLLARVPKCLTQRFPVMVLADTEFGTIEFLTAVRQRGWRAVVGVRANRQMSNGQPLQQLYRHGRRGQQVRLLGLDIPLTISWFWLKRSDGKRELRFIASIYPDSGTYLIRLGQKRWVIESFFKTIKHRFGLHCFSQKTRLGIDRWLLLSLTAFMLVHWVSRHFPSWWRLDWGEICAKALTMLLPQTLWFQLLQQIHQPRHLIDQLGFKITIQSLPLTYAECCKI